MAIPDGSLAYKTAVLHFPLAVTREDSEDVESWPGDGTPLLANAVEEPRPSWAWSRNVEETTVDWDLWFDYAAYVAAGVTVRRGDQLHIIPAVGAAIVLRAQTDARDVNQLGVAWRVH